MTVSLFTACVLTILGREEISITHLSHYKEVTCLELTTMKNMLTQQEMDTKDTD